MSWEDWANKKKKTEVGKWPFSSLILSSLDMLLESKLSITEIPSKCAVYTFYSHHVEQKQMQILLALLFRCTKECSGEAGDNVLVAFSLAHFHISIPIEKCRWVNKHTHSFSLARSLTSPTTAQSKLIELAYFRSVTDYVECKMK